MSTLELVRFLSDSASESIDKAEFAEARFATALLDEAEELLALGYRIMCRDRTNLSDNRKAA